MPSEPALERQPDFRALWLGQTVSRFGSHITQAAMAATAVIVLQATPAQMGVLGAAAGLPVWLVTLLAGVWVDRLRRKPLLMAADLGRALVVASVPVAAWLGVLSLTQLYLVALLAGALTVLYNVADQSFLPTVVARADLGRANARLGASDSLAEVAGPSVAGALIQLLGAPYAIVVDAATFVFSAFSLSRIRAVEAPPAPAPARPNVWREMAAGLRWVAHTPILRALAGALASLRFFGSFIGTIYWWFLVRDLGLAPAWVGVSIGAGGVGALVGALISHRLTQRFGVGRTLVGALCAAPLPSLWLLLPYAAWPPPVLITVLVVIQFVGDIAWAVFFINALSLRQALIPAAGLGRVSASLDFLGEGAAPLGAVVGGALASVIGARWTWLAGAAGLLTGAMWLYFSPAARLHALPTEPPV